MSARHHEAPAQRRSSAKETEQSTSRPLSSSFFAPIDPSVPVRQSSLHAYYQHIFPSKRNDLDSSLEVPYAFSHEFAAFYFREEDALENHKLNIWATPPCLNCEVAGEDFSRQCDRYERQEDSEGQIRCCTRCQRSGDHWGCIEQVEIRADGNYGRVLRHMAEEKISDIVEHEESVSVDEEDPKPVDNEESPTVNNEDSDKRRESIILDIVDYITVEFNPWCAEEQELRRTSVVWWEPINLKYGDADRKKEIVQEWMQQDAQSGLVSAQIDSSDVSWRILKQRAPQNWVPPIDHFHLNEVTWETDQAQKEALDERMTLCREINQELVAEWRKREGYPEREAEQVDHDPMAEQPQSDDDDEHSLLTARVKTSWLEKIRLGRSQQYYKEIAEVGLEVAELTQRAWEAREGHIFSQACHFLERKQYWMESGVDEGDAIALAKVDMSDEADEEYGPLSDLEELVPYIFRAGS